MRRAAVVIGVDKTGSLPRLRDAASSAGRVAEWARGQGMGPVELLTDATEPLEVSLVKKKIRAIVDASSCHQLLVFFAGHGVNRQRQEYWLLSGAPEDPQEAVNLAGSAALAMTCGIPHVVFISDACRTAAEGIRAQSVTGSEIFPNVEGDAAPVDQFFASELGRPSHEVKDPNVTAAEFSALYTGELLPALRGERREIVTWDATDPSVGRVHPRPLRDHLSKAVAKRLESLALQTKVIQVPTAVIASDPPAWLAVVKREPPDVSFLGGGDPDHGPATRSSAPSLSDRLAAMQPRSVRAAGDVRMLGEGDGRELALGSAVDLARPFGAMHHETECGFKIRGARIVAAFSPGARTEILPSGDDVRVVSQKRDSVLLSFDSGGGALLPALRGFITALTIDEGELIDVAYEPSDNSSRWSDYHRRADEIRSLRAIAAVSLTHGVFHLERSDALEVARRMQYAKGVDPSLAVYAAYAYHDLRRRDLLKEMSEYLVGDLGANLFDVALLARQLDGRRESDVSVISPFPLLSQGWALLRAFRVRLAPGLEGLEEHLRPSLWTLLDSEGLEQVKAALAAGDIR